MLPVIATKELSEIFLSEKQMDIYEYLLELDSMCSSLNKLTKQVEKLEGMLETIKESEYLSTLYVLALIKNADDMGGLDGKVPAEKAIEHIKYMTGKFGMTNKVLFVHGLWHRDIHKIAHGDIDRNKGVELLKMVAESSEEPLYALELAKALFKIGQKREAAVVLKGIIEARTAVAAPSKIQEEAKVWYEHANKDTKLEIRIPNISFLDKVLDTNCSVISIGSDSCPYCLPALEDLDTVCTAVKKAGKGLKLVTPVVFQKHWDMVVEYVNTVTKKYPDLKLVINDYGILNHLKNSGYNMKNVALGHVLSYIYEECPWFDYLLEAEGDFLKNSEEITVFDTPGNLSVIEEFGIGEVETCMMPFAVSSFYGFWEHGFNVNAMVDMIPFTYGRACHGARYYGKEVGKDCFGVCDKITKLRYSHRWIFQEKQLEKIKDVTYDRISVMHSYGNVIYSKTNYEATEKDVNKVDAITIDIRHYTEEELNSILQSYLPLTKNS